MGIGYRGAGAKYAAWYFGEDLEIRAKMKGEITDYSAKIPGFGNPTIEYQGMFPIDLSPTIWPQERGRFEIIVRRVKNPDKLPGGAVMRRALAEVYRPLLVRETVDTKAVGQVEPRIILKPDGEVKEVNDRIVLFLATRKRKRQVFPLEIPLLPGHSENNLEVARTRKGELIWFWVGEMDLKDKAAKMVKPGIRLYYDGRLLNIDYCGFNERDPRLAGLVGEAHLDNIEEIKSQLSVNKSTGVNTESEQWQRIIQAMKASLNPFIQALQERPLPLFEKRPEFLTRAFATARRLADLSLKDMAKEGALITPQDLRILMGETKGQRLTPRRQEREKREPEKTGKGMPWSDQRGQTIPDKDAQETIKRIRKSFIDGLDLRNLEDPTQVSVLASEPDASGRERQIIVLNASHPLVSAALLQGELAVIQLTGIQLAEAVAEVYSTTLEGFHHFKRELLFRFGQYLATTPAYRKLEIRELQEKAKGKKR